MGLLEKQIPGKAAQKDCEFELTLGQKHGEKNTLKDISKYPATIYRLMQQAK